MKKLMIAAFVAVIGVAANAAKVNWDVDNTYQAGTTKAAEGWQIYFFDNDTVARTAMLSAIEDGSYTSLLSGGKAASDLTDSDGYADGSSLRTDYANPSTMQGYFVLFNSDDASEATMAYVSALETANIGATAGQNGAINFGNVTATQTASNWTSVNVPEPTSGLLLLLGVAGLALKRRRA